MARAGLQTRGRGRAGTVRVSSAHHDSALSSVASARELLAPSFAARPHIRARGPHTAQYYMPAQPLAVPRDRPAPTRLSGACPAHNLLSSDETTRNGSLSLELMPVLWARRGEWLALAAGGGVGVGCPEQRVGHRPPDRRPLPACRGRAPLTISFLGRNHPKRELVSGTDARPVGPPRGMVGPRSRRRGWGGVSGAAGRTQAARASIAGLVQACRATYQWCGVASQCELACLGAGLWQYMRLRAPFYTPFSISPTEIGPRDARWGGLA